MISGCNYYNYYYICKHKFIANKKDIMKDIVVGIGEILWDMLPEGKKLGGAPANFAYHVSQFGFDGCAVSAVGDDALGLEMIDALSSKNVKHHIEKVSFPTGTVKIGLDNLGVPRYDIKEGVAWDNIPYTGDIESIAKQAKAVCFGSLAQRNGISRATINRFLDAVGKECLVVFDANLRQEYYSKEILEDSIKRCDILKINDEEIETVGKMFGIGDVDMQDKCRLILERYNLKMLILTCGVNGSYVFTWDKDSFQPTPKVDVADTVGAGDSFTAAYISSILKGHTIEEAHKIAVATSAYVCSQSGAMPQLPPALTGR